MSDLFTLSKHEPDALSPLVAWPMEHIEDANQVVFELPTSSYSQWLNREWLMPNQQICKMVVAVMVKITYRLVEVFLYKVVDFGVSHLGFC